MKQSGKFGSKLKDFYSGKKIFITGHTGFKGTWLCKVLESFNAEVYGYALKPHTKPNLFSLSNIGKSVYSFIGDIRDNELLFEKIKLFKPDIIFHLAAQAIVRESYIQPRETYETNIMGTINILESIRNSDSVKSFVNVTTDKVYKNREWVWAYREDEELNGYDPYSNSKSCSELVTETYKRSFFNEKNLSISTMRAGNVIGGGDFSQDRIVPDCIKSVMDKRNIQIRNPYSIRPYQHVLDPIFSYLLIAMLQYENKSFENSYNVGPSVKDCISTENLVKKFCNEYGTGCNWDYIGNAGPHEANFLKLDSSRLISKTGWKPVWDIDKAIKETVNWVKIYQIKTDEIDIFMRKQIKNFMSDIQW